MKKLLIILCVSTLIAGCNGGSSSTEPTSDSAVTEDSAIAPMKNDTSKMMRDTEMIPHEIHHDANRSPASVDTSEAEPNLSPSPKNKGYAIVYCPSKMITKIPSIVDAEISKNELTVAYSKFVKKIQNENPGTNIASIEKDVRGDSIDIFEKMSVVIEFDSDDFKLISKDNDLIQFFKGKNELEWDWTIKPLHSTERSIIKFKFYAVDPSSNQETSVLEKTINVSVHVDARSYFAKWSDFLLDDPKTTITAILIPFITFLGGFFTGKRKKN